MNSAKRYSGFGDDELDPEVVGVWGGGGCWTRGNSQMGSPLVEGYLMHSLSLLRRNSISVSHKTMAHFLVQSIPVSAIHPLTFRADQNLFPGFLVASLVPDSRVGFAASL